LQPFTHSTAQLNSVTSLPTAQFPMTTHPA
jgi:hypothetical protein